MDGSQFKRRKPGPALEKSNLGGVLDKLEAQVYYNYADHVMDNYSLRTSPTSGMMAGPMVSNVDRRTLGGRLKATWRWEDVTPSRCRCADQRTSPARRHGRGCAHKAEPSTKDADFHNYGVFYTSTRETSSQDRLVSGARLDRASAKDFREASATRGNTRADTLPSGFVRYEHDLLDLPATTYVGLGHAQRFPDYWELFSPKSGPAGSLNAFDSIKPEKTTQLDVGIQYKTEQLEAWPRAMSARCATTSCSTTVPA